MLPKSKEDDKYLLYHKYYTQENNFWPIEEGSINNYQQDFWIHSPRLGLKERHYPW
jgi:hypothetical protein